MATALSTNPDVRAGVAARHERAAELERQLCELAAHTHAAMAELTRLAAEFHDVDGWCGDGLRSFSDWLTLNTGFAPRTGDELLRVGQALEGLPQIRTAFGAGKLSFDSVRELSRVATAEDEPAPTTRTRRHPSRRRTFPTPLMNRGRRGMPMRSSRCANTPSPGTVARS